MGSIININALSEKYLGRKVLKHLANNELFIEFEDRLKGAIISALICLIYYLLSRIIFYVCSSTYRDLSRKDKMFWSLATVRGTYGFYGVLLSIYSRCFENDQFTHIINSKTELSYILIISHFGFFIFEWTAQIYFDFRFSTCNYQLHAHHLIAFIGFGGGAIGDTMHYFGLISFILELSTPFSCVCYCLIKSKMSDGRVWMINQFVLIHCFHMRNMIEMCMIFDTIKYWEVVKELPTYLLLNWLIGLATVFIVLTPYWTWKKTEQLFTKSDIYPANAAKKNK